MSFILLKNYLTSGAISYSSKFLTRLILSKINFEKANVIVELGPGNGCITREIISKMHSNSILISIEINPNFIQYLVDINDNRFHLIIDSAENLTKILSNLGITHVDYIVSSIPFKILPKVIELNIIKQFKLIANSNVVLIHYSYFMSQRTVFKSIFENVYTNFEIRNIPPAFVFVCGNQSSLKLPA